MPIDRAPAVGGVRRPPQPQSPASIQDVKDALVYTESIKAGLGGPPDSRAMAENYSAARVYETKVLLSHIRQDGNAVAQRLEEVNQQLHQINQQLQQMNQQLQQMNARLIVMDERTIRSLIVSARAHNSTCFDGNIRNYEVVLLPNGATPKSQGLPVLKKLSNIKRLPLADATRYCELYELGDNFANVSQRRIAIGLHIGCVVMW